MDNHNDHHDLAPTMLPTAAAAAPSVGQKRSLRELSGGVDDEQHDDMEQGENRNLKGTDEDEDTKTAANSTPRRSPQDDDNIVLPPTMFQKLRLEAIFYPKFDNEKQSQKHDNASPDIRQQMKQKIQQDGYLEVTLKHSGSLLLWSGGSRYYSKNSTDNVFTIVGEVVLRQHFLRAWYDDDDTNKLSISDNDQTKDADDSAVLSEKVKMALTQGQTMYQACSDYLEQHRLTLAMELVTAVLGDHGAVPNRDYVIVTALAHRDYYDHATHDDPTIPAHSNKVSQSWFASTPELLQFCHRFRLPHNDVWMFTSLSTVNQMLDAHDRWREHGTASTVIPAITAIADVHVASMYPHDVVQGDILEGVVVRYVPYAQHHRHQQEQQEVDRRCDDGVANSQAVAVMERMQSLAKSADEIRQTLVPADRTPAHQLPLLVNDINNKNIFAAIDLREIFETCHGRHPEGLTRMEKALRDILSTATVGDAVIKDGNNSLMISMRRVDRYLKRICVGFPSWVQPLLESPHHETRQIAKLIQTLHNLAARVDYNIWREHNPNSASTRWLCMIHVLHDTTFAKFRLKMKPGDMELFRGFCVEFGNWDDAEENPNQAQEQRALSSFKDLKVEEEEVEHSDDDTSNNVLMLKMKLLPYMVRTFACRNGIRAIKDGGSSAFHMFCVDLLNRWQVSDEAKQKWIPFFQAWGAYAGDCLQKQEGGSSTTGASPLSGSFYLEHLERFSKLYAAGKYIPPAVSQGSFRGLVVAVALDTTKAKNVSEYLGQELGGLKVVYNVNEVSPEDVLLARTPGCGFVCGTVVTHGVRNMRKLLKDHSAYISILLFGCTESSIAELSVTESEKKKIKGILTAWRAINHAKIFDLDYSSLSVVDGPERTYSPTNAFVDMVDKLRASAEALPHDDARHGLVIFFPGIPGCGKSTICSAANISRLRLKLSERMPISRDGTGSEVLDESSQKARNVVVRSGDAVNQNYWQLVQDERSKDLSCVYIADKNVPPSWETVGRVCAKTKGVAVPVFPKSALQTTVIMGMIRPDGSSVSNIRHVYPFSLAYLAVCMARVLDRREGSHQGKLDSGTKLSCWIVLQFFAFYQGITADRFLRVMKDQLKIQGAFTIQSGVCVPFFREESPPELPHELSQLLQEALQVQHGRKSKKIQPDDEFANVWEGRLRTTVSKYRDQLSGMTVDANATQDEFVAQVALAVEEVNLLPLNAKSLETSSYVKIVSIDVPREDVVSLVNDNSNDLSSFIAHIILHGKDDADTNNGTENSEDLFATNPHITLCHHGDVTQQFIHETFDSLCGKEVEVTVTGLLWSQHVAALAVFVPSSTIDGCPLPASKNRFPHITLWHSRGVAPYSSNELRDLVHASRAELVSFDSPAVLQGKISFWDKHKH